MGANTRSQQPISGGAEPTPGSRRSPRSPGIATTSAGPVVFVIDDDPSMRNSLRRLVASVGFEVQIFAGARAFLEARRPDTPGCLLLDVRLPGLSGLDLQRALADTDRELPIVFLTGHGDIPMSVRAMKAGAVDFLTKPCREQDLLDAIRSATERDRMMRKERRDRAELQRRYASLTPREQDVLALLVGASLNKQIAGELGTTEGAVKEQRTHLMAKMQASSLAELVRFASRLDIMPPADAPRLGAGT